MLVGSPVVAVVCRLVHLGLLLNGAVLAALASATLQRQDRAELTFECHTHAKRARTDPIV